MSTAITQPSRRRGMLKATVGLAMVAAVAALAMAAFRLGTMSGLAAAGGGLIVYHIPAVIFDWPRLTLQDVVDFVLGIFSAIGSFFASLFDW